MFRLNLIIQLSDFLLVRRLQGKLLTDAFLGLDDLDGFTEIPIRLGSCCVGELTSCWQMDKFPKNNHPANLTIGENLTGDAKRLCAK